MLFIIRVLTFICIHMIFFHVGTYMVSPLHSFFFSVFLRVLHVGRLASRVDMPVGVWSWLEFTDASGGLRLEQPRGSCPSLYPLAPSGGGALILCNFESKMQIVILSRYERICVLHVREKFSLTNQMSTVYLYSSSLFVVPTCDSLYRRLASEARSKAE